MAILSSRDLRVAKAIGQIGYCNPFLPERLALERLALGAEFRCADPVMNLPPDADLKAIFPNFTALRERAEVLSEKMRSRLLGGTTPKQRELRIYQDTAMYLLYNRHMSCLDTVATAPAKLAKTEQKAAAWNDFQRDFDGYLQLPGFPLPAHFEPGHCFAVFFQISGAVTDRQSWLETAGPQETVFLDEIGELDLSIQVKLLRVLQNGSFSRVGETQPREFAGKFVAATNRDLSQEMAAGRFREDLYYRLCADMIHTPTLHEQIADCPDDLQYLAEVIARRVLTDLPEESQALARETVDWIAVQMGPSYTWPGNIRELVRTARSSPAISAVSRPAVGVPECLDVNPRTRRRRFLRGELGGGWCRLLSNAGLHGGLAAAYAW